MKDNIEAIKWVRQEIDYQDMQEIKKRLMFLYQKYYERRLTTTKILAWKLRKKKTENTIKV